MYNFSLLLFLFILSECCRITILVRADLEKKFANSIKVRFVESSVIFSIIVSLWLIIASRLDHLRSKQFSLNQFEGGRSRKKTIKLPSFLYYLLYASHVCFFYWRTQWWFNFFLIIFFLSSHHHLSVRQWIDPVRRNYFLVKRVDHCNEAPSKIWRWLPNWISPTVAG